ncbi:hypothetical protein AVEN_221865-1 [Araneus ventricosus]|uniref:Uncharacterized protein n=1 Tax=Araneus ventricosus TaxID=182803 RepID=A0A4Y2TBQ0_ARAVE|nr:hypothetical protein AVEN_221865-1 [Araneus ventricosus]
MCAKFHQNRPGDKRFYIFGFKIRFSEECRGLSIIWLLQQSGVCRRAGEERETGKERKRPYADVSDLGMFSLIVLTSRFEVTGGVFWDGPRSFEPRSNDDT